MSPDLWRRQQTQKHLKLPQTDHFVAAENWPDTVAEARIFAHKAIDTFKFERKKAEFRRLVDKFNTVERIQRLIINALLSGEGLCIL